MDAARRGSEEVEWGAANDAPIASFDISTDSQKALRSFQTAQLGVGADSLSHHIGSSAANFERRYSLGTIAGALRGVCRTIRGIRYELSKRSVTWIYSRWLKPRQLTDHEVSVFQTHEAR
ncbi:unnamed protein product [Echinostoma caproni]|uniref:Transposase n=1 Tax=Echinostoma caproni TaxID=27848 RepID=A0A183AP14_9TREM|nr:unnamed protein product [Echinostoma caproni]